MTIGKVAGEDFKKLVKEISKSRFAQYIQISIDGPRILFTFTGDDGKMITVTLFDSQTPITPTITRTETL